MPLAMETTYIRWLADLGSRDLADVGGKNASLGEMICHLGKEGVRVPDGFATTAEAYWDFVRANDLADPIRSRLDELHRGQKPLSAVGRAIRKLFRTGHFSEEFAQAIRQAYQELGRRYDTEDVDVAVRSSATAEDLPEASFAGQQESFLNISGEDALLEVCRTCYASLFTDRAIAYRDEKSFDHMKVALSVGVQKMVRSDKAGAGVMFTLDTETGFPRVVLINAGWGLGESVVKGVINPDQYMVFKPLLATQQCHPIIEKTRGTKEKKIIYASGGSHATRSVETTPGERRAFVLNDDEILQLAQWGVAIENHYGAPQDIEWAKDGETGELFIVQARPETVQSLKQGGTLRNYRLVETGRLLLTGLSIGGAIASGKVSLIRSPEQIDRFRDGAILVTTMTDPDWVPIMKRAAGIITDTGGRTCHAAIVSRELGIPAVVGTGKATDTLAEGQEITLSCAQGEQGVVYDGLLRFEEEEARLDDLPVTRTRIMMNIASPGAAFRWWRLPCKGIGLARMEFIINNIIQVHPMALVHFDQVKDHSARRHIEELTRGYSNKAEYFVDSLARGIAKIAAAQHPEPVIVRLSDFKTNEYADLIGGKAFEPREANPMLGFRGASRYYDDRYRDGFALECQALRRVRDDIGLSNVVVMVPFCRTPAEADRVLEEMARNGLRRGENGLLVYVMCEVPSNVILAEAFGERFDGFSIGSNDLTQLVLGVDRDSSILAPLFDERNEAVKRMIRSLITTAHEHGLPVGICGEAPSNYPDFAAFLVQAGIDSISLNPDSVIEVIRRVAQAEQTTRTAE